MGPNPDADFNVISPDTSTSRRSTWSRARRHFHILVRGRRAEYQATAAGAQSGEPEVSLSTESSLGGDSSGGIPRFPAETSFSPPHDWLGFGESDSARSDYSDEYREGLGSISQTFGSQGAHHATLSNEGIPAPSQWVVTYEPSTTAGAQNNGSGTSNVTELAVGLEPPRGIPHTRAETSFPPPYDWLDFREPDSAWSDYSTEATHVDDFDLDLPTADSAAMGNTGPAILPNHRLSPHEEFVLPRGYAFDTPPGQQFTGSNNLAAYRFSDFTEGNIPPLFRLDRDSTLPLQGPMPVMVRRSGLLDVPWTEGMPENAQCPICYDTRVANTFSCTGTGTPHGVCNSCFKGLTGGGRDIAFKCPICRAIIPKGWSQFVSPIWQPYGNPY